MITLRVIPLSPLSELAIRTYIDSCTNPSVKDRLRMWKAKKIEGIMYKQSGIVKPVMVREEFDLDPLSLSFIVLDNYESYGDDLIVKAKLNYLSLFKVNEKELLFEVLK